MKLVTHKSFEARLIPLNKKWPNIPSKKDFKLIAVQSPLIKWLEARSLPQLQGYLLEKLDKSEIGFVPNC